MPVGAIVVAVVVSVSVVATVIVYAFVIPISVSIVGMEMASFPMGSHDIKIRGGVEVEARAVSEGTRKSAL